MANIHAIYGTNPATDSNSFTTAEQSKLSGVEASATADQTNAEIKTAYETNANTNEFSDAEQTKLAGVEASATADQTNAEIKTAYEANADTNEFSDAEQTKLAGVEAAADVTDDTNVRAALAAATADLDFNAKKATNLAEPTASNHAATKNYVDTANLGQALFQGTWNASTNSPALASATGTQGHHYRVNTAGATNLDGITDWKVGDWAYYDGTAWDKVDNTSEVSSVAGKTGAVSLDTDDITEAAKLFYTDARVATHVATLGSTIKTAYEAESDTNAFSDAEQTKLSGVETSATADQTGAEIKTAYEAENDTNAFSDSHKTKLDHYGSGLSGTVQTTNATVTTVATHTPTDNTVVTLQAVVSGRKSDGSQGAGYTLMGTFRRSGATTTQIGSTSVMGSAEDDASWDATFATSGSAINVDVTGKAATTIDWRSRGSVVEAP